MRRYLLLFAALFLVSVLLLGCGGGSGGPANSISGTVTGATFSIPAGETRTATGDLTIDTTNGITIDGTLLVEPGVNVTLLSHGPVVINGGVDEAPTKSALSVRAGTAAEPTVVICGSEVDVFGFYNAHQSAKVYIAVESPGTTINVTGGLRSRAGVDSTTAGVNGTNGGLIEIGTATAADKAKQKGYPNAVIPKRVILGTIDSGRGGNGYPDETGKLVGTTLFLKGTNAGNGGDIRVTAGDTIEFEDGAQIKAGSGGHGGSVGYQNSPVASQNGVDAGQAGYDMDVTSGNGGNGGSVTYSAPSFVGTVSGEGGYSGDAGDIYIRPGGGGWGGRGGNSTLVVGKRGTAGTSPIPVIDFLAKPVVYLTGANGGSAGSTGLKGGGGGNVIIGSSAGGPATAEVIFENACNGGTGAKGSTTVPGTNGGDAGRITVQGINYVMTNSFRGGDGGDGHPPGAGGDGGRDETSKKIGVDGNPGKYLGLG